MTSDSDDESVRRLWEELLALRKIVKDAEANLPNAPCRYRIHPTNGTAQQLGDQTGQGVAFAPRRWRTVGINSQLAAPGSAGQIDQNQRRKKSDP